ncbi:glycosyltransferase family 2 protein [Pontibacter cellulosilyticus]|uniref:Glycosyltransferase family 2 protein n=1 Tax=Pontibacter cellulosilyticus TaxID=1720253 RepID=A0A923SJB1_9BACT|nr:glycosyltransferase family 2 protein [Pontibacter cellulosilyticus]MBC5992531.1 glycosyltransferase family 2 protein [Pontibacter cellulosilyticus]
MIYIVIPVLNRWSFTQACLKSLQRQTFSQFQVIVIDHGSSDGTCELIAAQFPEVTVLTGNDQMWWAAATNVGIRHAIRNSATYVLTLNNDTVAQPDYIERLIETTKVAPKLSLIGSTAVDYNTGKVLYRGELINWLTETSRKLVNSEHIPESGLFELTHFPGRGLLIPIEVFNTVGLFDEVHFPHYMSDYEFTLRARKEGFKIFCACAAFLSIYPEASGANQLINRKTIKNYYYHLFGMKGGANLPLFYRYAFRHCPLYALPSFLLLGTTRRLLGYWLRK